MRKPEMHIIDEKQSTLKEVSYDKEHDEYMTESNLPVCSFDNVKEWYVQNKIPYAKPNPKSNDALFLGEEIFFIEFKNGKIDNRVNFEINKKIYDSLLLLFDLNYIDKEKRLIDSISYTREKMNFILVYNEERNSGESMTMQTKEGLERQKAKVSVSLNRDKLYSGLRKLAKEEFIKYGLDQFKNYLFKNVYTYNKKDFEEYFVKKQLDRI